MNFLRRLLSRLFRRPTLEELVEETPIDHEFNQGVDHAGGSWR